MQTCSSSDTAQKAAVWQEPRPWVKEIYLLNLKHLPEEHKSVGTISEGGTRVDALFIVSLYLAGTSTNRHLFFFLTFITA